MPHLLRGAQNVWLSLGDDDSANPRPRRQRDAAMIDLNQRRFGRRDMALRSSFDPHFASCAERSLVIIGAKRFAAA